MNIKCPHCGTEYEVEKKDMYRYTKCEVCGNGFVVGATTSLQKSADQSQQHPSRQQQTVPVHTASTRRGPLAGKITASPKNTVNGRWKIALVCGLGVTIVILTVVLSCVIVRKRTGNENVTAVQIDASAAATTTGVFKEENDDARAPTATKSDLDKQIDVAEPDEKHEHRTTREILQRIAIRQCGRRLGDCIDEDTDEFVQVDATTGLHCYRYRPSKGSSAYQADGICRAYIDPNSSKKVFWLTVLFPPLKSTTPYTTTNDFASGKIVKVFEKAIGIKPSVSMEKREEARMFEADFVLDSVQCIARVKVAICQYADGREKIVITVLDDWYNKIADGENECVEDDNLGIRRPCSQKLSASECEERQKIC